MKICLACSHGGHLTELLELAEAFKGHRTFLVTYVCRRTKEMRADYTMPDIGYNPLRMLWAFLKVFWIFCKERPDAIVSIGAEIAIPTFYLGKLFGARTIFIESVCRINSASLAGKIVYPISDKFFVQWKQTLAHYGEKARYFGGLL